MQTFEFQYPWCALLLPLPWLIIWLTTIWSPPKINLTPPPSFATQTITLLHPQLNALRLAYRSRRHSIQATWLYPVLLTAFWLLSVVALMNPRWLELHTEIRHPGYDLFLAVDTSHSMDALDFSVANQQVSRMAVVKGVMGRFLDSRINDRLGLIIFGSAAYVLSPLTPDRYAVHQLLDNIVPSIAGPSTALGDAIALGVKKLRDRPIGSRVMVLIADGDNTAGNFQPLEAAALAHHAGIRIYVIGVGSQQTHIPILHQGRIEYWDDLTMNEDILTRIATTTGGAYFRATDTQALETISNRINLLEKTDIETRTAYLPHTLYRWPLGAALIILLILGLLPEGQRRVLR